MAEIERQLTELAGPREPLDAKAKKQRRILEAATGLFIEQGYRKTSVDEIARQAHVGKGTVYTYFANKALVLAGAIALEKRAYMAEMVDFMDESRPARDRLKDLVRSGLVLSQKMPLVSRLMSGDQELAFALADLEASDSELWAQSAKLRQLFVAELLNDAHGGTWSEAEAAERTSVFNGFLQFASLIGRPEVRNGLSLERFAELMAEMLVDGIAQPVTQRST